MTRIPFTLLFNYEPSVNTRKKRFYEPTMPFKLSEEVALTPADIWLDYINLFFFIFLTGLAFFLRFL